MGKERSWTAQAEAQGETFYPLAIEAGGAINERFHEFLVTLASSSSHSPPERDLFLGYALQRIRAVSLKGVCAIILGRPTSPGAPGGLHTRGSLPLAQPKPRPLGRPFAPVGLRLGDLRGGPRLAAGPRLGARTCPRQSQLASQLLNFPSRVLRPPLRQHPCLSIRSAHPHPPLARGGARGLPAV